MNKLRSFDRRILRNWFPIALIVTVLIGLIYITTQQNLRQGANDPQIQIAEDTAMALAGGASAESLSSESGTNPETSLATFVTVYDKDGRIIGTTAKLGQDDLVLPKGVLDYTAKHTENRVTWQPKASVRIAAVIRHYRTPSGDTGFVLVGRNLREVERRQNILLIYCACAWAIAMTGSLGLRLVLTTKK
jgi:hypothetical protein